MIIKYVVKIHIKLNSLEKLIFKLAGQIVHEVKRSPITKLEFIMRNKIYDIPLSPAARSARCFRHFTLHFNSHYFHNAQGNRLYNPR